MKIERPRLGGGDFLSVVRRRRRGDRFFPGTLFQDRHRRPQAAGEPELIINMYNEPIFEHTFKSLTDDNHYC